MVPVPPKSSPVWSCAVVLTAVTIIGCVLLPATAQAQNALPFARSYLVTGNYAVVGVDLLPQAADCTTFSGGCYVKGSITVPVCPANPAPGSCIPAGADVLAAFIYWETLSPDPTAIPVAKFKNQSVTNGRRSDISLPSQASCLSSGATLTMSMYSADVLHFFPIQNDANGQSTGRRLVTGTHEVALPEVGTGNNARQSAGASLFFLYRLSSEPLRKVVVYDGAYLSSIGSTMRQTLQGFYQSWDLHQSAWLTHIVGSGAKNETERLKFNDALVASDVIVTDPFPFPLGNSGGNGSDRAWANPTVDVSTKMVQTSTLTGFGETATTEVDHTNNTPYECLSWAAVIFSAAVKDADSDGLPDGLENSTAGLKDPSPADLPTSTNPAGRVLPNLNAMGASSLHKDVFIEMNGMRASGDAEGATSYGSPTYPFSTILSINTVTDHVGHYHLPTPEVIKTIGDALKNAPTSIALHVDVGSMSSYKGLPGHSAAIADEYLICQHAENGSCTSAAFSEARGGENLKEVPCNPNLQTSDPAQPNSIGCHFPDFPGTVGWKFGFQHYRDQAVDGTDGHELTTAQETQCYTNGTYTTDSGTFSCRRRFDPNRAGLFHYFLYAHALGIPKGNPCLDSNGKDVPYPISGTTSCGSLTLNPNFHVPKSFSGVGDEPGGDALITLGLWDMVNFVGSPFLQAATSFHELGHNFELSHAGKPPIFGNASTANAFEPNCKPNYPSIMSYLFQVNGLIDALGNPRIDYSRAAYYDRSNGTLNQVLDETQLHDGDVSGTGGLALPDTSLASAFQYRTAWFVPVVAPVYDQNNVLVTPGNLAYALGVQPAGRYCSGVDFGTSTPAPMGRIDGPSLASAIDWALDGPGAPTQDVNFDGVPNASTFTQSYEGYNDWLYVRLDQTGGGRNPEGYSLGQGGFGFGQGGFGFGKDAFDFGQGGFGFGQGGFGFGQGGFGFGTGGFQLGDGAYSFGQGGFGFGQGGFGFGQGGFGFGQGGFGFGKSDVDFDHVKQMGNTPPVATAACVIQASGPCTGTAGQLHRTRVTWAPPNAGTVSSYRVYRFAPGIPGSSVDQLCGATGTPPCPSGTSFVDAEELPYNQTFNYFVRAVFSNCNSAKEKCESGPSTFATITTENTAPVAVNDPSGNNKWTVSPGQSSALTLLVNDTDVDSATRANFRVLITVQPAHGSVAVYPGTSIAMLAADGSLLYTPALGYSGTDTLKYKADDGTWRTTGIKMSDWSTTEATVTFTVKK